MGWGIFHRFTIPLFQGVGVSWNGWFFESPMPGIFYPPIWALVTVMSNITAAGLSIAVATATLEICDWILSRVWTGYEVRS